MRFVRWLLLLNLCVEWIYLMQEEGYDVPVEIEEVLGLLVSGLRDRDTVVRWSAAKGYVRG